MKYRPSALLIHGLGRTPVSMFPLAGAVRRAGVRTHFFGYISTLESINGIVGRLVRTLQTLRPEFIMAHSLGGILSRLALQKIPVPSVRHLIMLGTPNRPPRLAAKFWPWLPSRLLLGTCGRFLAHPAEYERLQPPTVPCTVIAGTAGPVGRFRPFGNEPNDGVVSVSETELPGAERLLVPALHTLMMNDRQVHNRVAAIIR